MVGCHIENKKQISSILHSQLVTSNKSVIKNLELIMLIKTKRWLPMTLAKCKLASPYIPQTPNPQVCLPILENLQCIMKTFSTNWI